MPTTRVKMHIPENRQVTITLPEDFPLGDVELEIVLRRPFSALLYIDETPEEREAFWANILAYRDEVNRATKFGSYAVDEEDDQPFYVE